MRYVAFLMSGTLVSCANITAVPLNATGMPDRTVPGIRYYLPRPYILITEIPVPPPAAPEPATSSSGQAKGGDAKPGTSGDKAAQTSQSSVPTSGATDLSFSAAMTSYSVKLVYLPDYRHPMALQEHSGLFGNVALSPTLADGWMLTSLTSTNDSGGAAALSAVASLVGSAVGGVTTGGASKVAGASLGVPPFHSGDDVAGYVDLSKPPGSDAGRQPSGTQSPKMIVKTVTRTIYATQPSWGTNVLPAGLYAFDVDPKQGELFGLKPVVFFCPAGPEAPVLRNVNATGGAILSLYVTPCEHPKVQ